MQDGTRSEARQTMAAFAVIALAALLQRHLVMPNPDVAWLLTVAQKWLDGAKLYVDVLETNPPASIWLYAPFELLARLTSLRAETLVDGAFLIAAAMSSLSAGAWVGHDHAAPRWMVRALTFAILALLPASCFGEREHAALIAFLPLMAIARQRADGKQVAWEVSLPASMLVGFVACLKPHFILALGLTSVAAAVAARSLRPIFNAENLIGAALFLAYVASTALLYPEFWRDMLPVSNQLYLPARLPVVALLYGNLPLIAAEALVVAGYVASLRRSLIHSRAMIVGGAAMLGFLLVAIVQGKGWPYHFYPALGLLILMTGTAALDDLRNVARTRFIATSATMLFAVQFWQLFNTGLDMRSYLDRMRAIDPHPRMASLASDFALGFPAVRTLQGTWIGRSFSRWIPYHVFGLSQEPGFDRGKLEAFHALEEQDRAGFIEDLRKGRPTLILVERRPFDMFAWATKDERLAKVLTCYEAADRILVGELDTPKSHGLDVELYRPRAGMTDAQREIGCAPHP